MSFSGFECTSEVHVGTQSPETYVEIGLGIHRTYGYGEGYPFNPGDIYFGLDLPLAKGHEAARIQIDTEKMIFLTKAAFREALASGSSLPPNLTEELIEAPFQFADRHQITFVPEYIEGETLPLEDISVKEVLLCNVAGDPNINSRDKTTLIDEALRVTRPDGRVVLNETYTPHIAHNTMGYYRRNSDLADVADVTVLDEASEDWQAMYELGYYRFLSPGRLEPQVTYILQRAP